MERSVLLFVFCRPVFFVGLARTGNAECVFGNVLGNDASGGDVGTRANRYGSDQRGMTADKSVVFNGGFVLADAVKVDGGGAAAEIAAAADFRVADIG